MEPADESILAHAFSLTRPAGKAENKLALQKEMACQRAGTCHCLARFPRLAEQKGVDIQLGALEEMLSADMQFVLLGSGSRITSGAIRTGERFPSKVAVRVDYDESLGASHRGRL
jgi:starch synthase